MVFLIVAIISKSEMSRIIPSSVTLLIVRRLLVNFVRRSVSDITMPRYFSCISGGMVPSSIASRYPFMEVNGERKSWDMLAINFFWYSLRLLISAAIQSRESESLPISSLCFILIFSEKSPLAYLLTIFVILLSGLVMYLQNNTNISPDVIKHITKVM